MKTPSKNHRSPVPRNIKINISNFYFLRSLLPPPPPNDPNNPRDGSSLTLVHPRHVPKNLLLREKEEKERKIGVRPTISHRPAANNEMTG